MQTHIFRFCLYLFVVVVVSGVSFIELDLSRMSSSTLASSFFRRVSTSLLLTTRGSSMGALSHDDLW